MKEFDTIHKNIIVTNDNIKNIGLENKAIEEKVVSIEKKLSSTIVEQKLDNLEKSIENLQLLKSATPMDITPTPHTNMPLSEPLYSSAPNVLLSVF